MLQTALRIVDISQNRIAKLENLACLPHLQTLNASKNFLAEADSVKELTLCLSLTTVDLAHNNIDGEDILDTLVAVPALISINLVGNPIMNTPQFRKKAIYRMPRLAYMDRPVFEAERVAAEAWGAGGREAEMAAREEWRLAQKNKEKEERRVFREWKAAKMEERRKKIAETGSAAAPTDQEGAAAASGGGNRSSGGGHGEVNITKLAHKFWSAEATRSQRPEPVPNAMGNFDVASFRAPSYVPDPIGFDDFEVKEDTEEEPPPLPEEEGAEDIAQESEGGTEPAAPPSPGPAEPTVTSNAPPAPTAVATTPKPPPPPPAVEEIQSPALSGRGDIGASESSDEVIRKQRVRESLAMYRSSRKQVKQGADAPVDGATAVASATSAGFESMAVNSQTGALQARSWTEDMDMRLATLIRRDASTFEGCAAALNKSGTVPGTPLSAEECNQRWADLTFGSGAESISGGTTHVAPSDLNFAMSGGETSDAPAVSRYLTKPTMLPSTEDIDGNDDSSIITPPTPNVDEFALPSLPPAHTVEATTDFDELD